MVIVRWESDSNLVNCIANSDGVREYIRPDGATMDWTPLVERNPAFTRTVLLSNGEDALAAFELTAPGIYQSHTLFARTCRGRRAIDTAKAMIAWMFSNGACRVWGSTPRTNRKALWFNRQIGAVMQPTSDQTDVIFEIRRNGWAG